MSTQDRQILHDLAQQYAEVAADPIQDERRKLWSQHMSLQPTRPLVLMSIASFCAWAREAYADKFMSCQDPFYRNYERLLKSKLFHATLGDDTIFEPWLSVGAVTTRGWNNFWGVDIGSQAVVNPEGAWTFDPPLKTWDDMDKLTPPEHKIDEVATARNVERLQEAVGDVLTVDASRTPAGHGFLADLSTDAARLRGLEQLMMDMYTSPKELHQLLAFMRDGILANQQAGEDAGDYSLTSSVNQAMTYCDDLEWPQANSGPRKRAELWGFCAAQEYTLISPKFHDEFVFQYQKPIFEHFGLVHYGCCENLTKKIDMLRPLTTLRSIAVTPTADVKRCAEQIGTDYVVSWRPNPAEQLCTGWNEEFVRKSIAQGIEDCRGTYMHIHLKDIEALQGDIGRLQRWMDTVRDVIDHNA